MVFTKEISLTVGQPRDSFIFSLHYFLVELILFPCSFVKISIDRGDGLSSTTDIIIIFINFACFAISCFAEQSVAAIAIVSDADLYSLIFISAHQIHVLCFEFTLLLGVPLPVSHHIFDK